MVNWSKYDNNTPMMGFEGETKEAKVVSVYDGDTIKVVFPIYYKVKGIKVIGKFIRWNCRLVGVDTPELRTRDKKEKEYGYYVRDKLREIILDRVVNITCGKFDKYGRLLIDINTKEGLNIKTWLISNNYAFGYDGGTKQSWTNYLTNKNNANKITINK